MVDLKKGQTVSLKKRDGGTLTNVRMGLGWDAKKVRGFLGRMKEQAIDLDASALLFDSSGRLVDQVWFKQLTSKDGALRHTGDNQTGAGDGDDESIMVDLAAVAPEVRQIVFVVNSFTGENFTQIENAFCRLVDVRANDAEVARYSLTGSGTHNSQVMAKVSRDGAGWSMTAIGATADGRTFRDLLPAVVPHL